MTIAPETAEPASLHAAGTPDRARAGDVVDELELGARVADLLARG